VNENNRGIWEKFEPGDIALLHSTAKSGYSNNTPSAVVGYAIIASKKWVKSEPWWMQEKESGQNMWPYVFTLDEIYLFEDFLSIDFGEDNIEKSKEKLKKEVETLARSGLPIAALNKAAKLVNLNVPSFPVNGSASGVNEAYEKLILGDSDDFYLYSDSTDTSGMIERLDEVLDRELLKHSIDEIRRAAETYKPSGEGYTEKEGVFRVRKDNETQKRRIARIENYSCQICGFTCEYRKSNGAQGWIIEVDHIVDKHNGGDERMNNLWVLCPNCHAKKTRGVLSIDMANRKINVNGHEAPLHHDKHLFI
jgi:5-methylcytosine-specific restriction endonuclease McrA